MYLDYTLNAMADDIVRMSAASIKSILQVTNNMGTGVISRHYLYGIDKDTKHILIMFYLVGGHLKDNRNEYFIIDDDPKGDIVIHTRDVVIKQPSASARRISDKVKLLLKDAELSRTNSTGYSIEYIMNKLLPIPS